MPPRCPDRRASFTSPLHPLCVAAPVTLRPARPELARSRTRSPGRLRRFQQFFGGFSGHVPTLRPPVTPGVPPAGPVPGGPACLRCLRCALCRRIKRCTSSGRACRYCRYSACCARPDRRSALRAYCVLSPGHGCHGALELWTAETDESTGTAYRCAVCPSFVPRTVSHAAAHCGVAGCALYAVRCTAYAVLRAACCGVDRGQGSGVSSRNHA